VLNIKSMDGEPFGISNAHGIFDIIGRCKLISDIKRDSTGEKTLANISLLLEKAPLADAEIFNDGDKTGIFIPVLFPDRYFIFDNGKLGDILKKLGMPGELGEVSGQSATAAGAAAFNEEEFDRLAGEYGKFLASFIGEENVRYGKNVFVKLGEKEVRGKEVLLTLDKDDAERLFKEAAEKAGADHALLALTYGNYAELAGLAEKSGFFKAMDLLESKGLLNLNGCIKSFFGGIRAVRGIEEIKRVISDAGKRTAFPEGLKMKLIIDGSGTIIDRTAGISFIKADTGEKYALDIHTGANDAGSRGFDNFFAEITFKSSLPSGENCSEEIRISTVKTSRPGKDGRQKYETVVFYEKKNDGVIEFGAEARIEGERGSGAAYPKSGNDIIGFDMEFWGGDPQIRDRIYGDISVESSKNDKRKTVNTVAGVVLNVEMPSMGLKKTTFKLDMTREDSFAAFEFKPPALDGKKITDLSNASNEELERIMREAELSLGAFYLNNKPIVDALMK